MGTTRHPNSRMVNDGVSNYSASGYRDIPDSGELRMTAQIIPFRDYQNPRDVAPMNGDIETRLAELNHMAAEIFEGLMIDTAAAEYSAPDKNLLLFFQGLCEELPTRDVVPTTRVGPLDLVPFPQGWHAS
jgi:hypothetical protein